MSVSTICLLVVAIAQPAGQSGSEEYAGLYLRTKKVGYVHWSTQRTTRMSKPVVRLSMTMVFTFAEAAGKVSGVTYQLPDGTPISTRAEFRRLDGQEQVTEVVYGPESVKWNTTKNGKSTSGSEAVPKDGKVYKDGVASFDFTRAKPGESHEVYEFDAEAHKFYKQRVTYRGRTTAQIMGKMVPVRWFSEHSPSEDSESYCDDSRNLLKQVDTSEGLTMVRESKDSAMAPMPKDGLVGLAELSMVPSKGELKLPKDAAGVKVMISGVDEWAIVPSDDFQTSEAGPNGWIIQTHPAHANRSALKIQEAGSKHPEWLRPDAIIQSNDPKIVALAKTIIGKETLAIPASIAIQKFVYSKLQYDMKTSLVDQRTATQILKSGKGVCRDYAILSAAIMRAAGIPTRLVYGLVGAPGVDAGFYYHAWISVFVNDAWTDMEVTGPNPELATCYLELGAGTYADASRDQAHLDSNVMVTIPHH